MTSGQADSSSERLAQSLSQKVEGFLKSLSPDELRAFVASLTPSQPSGAEAETQGFGALPDIRFRPPGKLPPLCRWEGLPDRPFQICWVCGSQVMYCQSFG